MKFQIQLPGFPIIDGEFDILKQLASINHISSENVIQDVINIPDFIHSMASIYTSRNANHIILCCEGEEIGRISQEDNIAYLQEYNGNTTVELDYWCSSMQIMMIALSMAYRYINR